MTDKVKIFVKAGNGGNGCNSFRGLKFTRSRRADGGHGGNGADIIFKVDRNLLSLDEFKFRQHCYAEHGKAGESNKKKGADARPCIIRVPPGTIVRDLKYDIVLRDLVNPEEELLAAKGGRGGRGNVVTNEAMDGTLGEEKQLLLELKLIADVAVIGYPNAGKSTLLSKLTQARPKIANYPFTTTTPFLGVLVFSDFKEPHSLTLIELPALVDGAHQGKGLGAEFLRHGERAKAVLYVLDMSGQEGRDPIDDYRHLAQELLHYNPGLAQKNKIIAANKMDLPGAEERYKRFLAKTKEKVLAISALQNTGIEALAKQLRSILK
ncbi:MAG: Obg family GTPase CgtA [Candidatus Omnitrophota bacterium]